MPRRTRCPRARQCLQPRPANAGAPATARGSRHAAVRSAVPGLLPVSGNRLPQPSSRGAFVVNLGSSSTPVALSSPEHPELKKFTFFVSRRREDGRERFRLHMGYFDTQQDAEALLEIVREIYPGAWAGIAPGRKAPESVPLPPPRRAPHGRRRHWPCAVPLCRRRPRRLRRRVGAGAAAGTRARAARAGGRTLCRHAVAEQRARGDRLAGGRPIAGRKPAGRHAVAGPDAPVAGIAAASPAAARAAPSAARAGIRRGLRGAAALVDAAHRHVGAAAAGDLRRLHAVSRQGPPRRQFRGMRCAWASSTTRCRPTRWRATSCRSSVKRPWCRWAAPSATVRWPRRPHAVAARAVRRSARPSRCRRPPSGASKAGRAGAASANGEDQQRPDRPVQAHRGRCAAQRGVEQARDDADHRRRGQAGRAGEGGTGQGDCGKASGQDQGEAQGAPAAGQSRGDSRCAGRRQPEAGQPPRARCSMRPACAACVTPPIASRRRVRRCRACSTAWPKASAAGADAATCRTVLSSALRAWSAAVVSRRRPRAGLRLEVIAEVGAGLVADFLGGGFAALLRQAGREVHAQAADVQLGAAGRALIPAQQRQRQLRQRRAAFPAQQAVVHARSIAPPTYRSPPSLPHRLECPWPGMQHE